MITVLTSNGLGKDIGEEAFLELDDSTQVVVLLSDMTRVTGPKNQVSARLPVILATNPALKVTSYHLVEVKE